MSKNQEHWYPRAREEKCLSSNRVNSVFLHLFGLLKPSTGWMMTTCIHEGALYSVDCFNCKSLLDTPSQTYQILFYRLSGHRSAQSNLHIKWAIRIIFPKNTEGFCQGWSKGGGCACFKPGSCWAAKWPSWMEGPGCLPYICLSLIYFYQITVSVSFLPSQKKESLLGFIHGQ